MLDTLLHNVRFLRSGEWQLVDLAIEGEKIVEIAGSIEASSRKEIDGQGAFVFPGAVDLHVHFNEPGRTNWEGFASGSAAAAAGGVTFVAEMPLNSIPSTVSVEALQIKLDAIGSQSAVDFGLWGGLVPGNVDQIEALSDAGVMGFKAFMSPSGTNDFENADHTTLKAGMSEIAKTGLRLALHAEDPAVLKAADRQLSQRQFAADWEASRPVEAELSAVRIAIDLAGETGCPITIVHVSSAEVVELISDAKRAGVDIICETCPHYLLLSILDAERIGSAAKCAPPLRQPEVLDGLRAACFAGAIDTIGSDHSPSSPDLKEGKNFFEAWGGISGLQHGIPLILSRWGLDDLSLISCLQKQFSGNPAALINLAEKGALAVGQDADFFLVRADGVKKAIEPADLLYRHQQSAYCELSLSTSISETWLRGQAIFQNGRILGEPKGRFYNFSQRR